MGGTACCVEPCEAEAEAGSPGEPSCSPAPARLTCAMMLPQDGSNALLSAKLWMLKAPMRSAATPAAPSAQSAANRARGPPMADTTAWGAQVQPASKHALTIVVSHPGCADNLVLPYPKTHATPEFSRSPPPRVVFWALSP